MEKVCRLCLRAQENMIHIFGKDEDSTLFLLQIKDCCAIELVENDCLPKFICIECKGRVTMIREFREQCKLSDLKLREYYEHPVEKEIDRTQTVQSTGVQTEDKPSLIASKRRSLIKKRKKVVKQASSTSIDGVNKNVIKPEVCHITTTTNCSTNGNNWDLRNNDWNLEEEPEETKQTKPKKQAIRKGWSTAKQKKSFVCHMCQKVYLSKKALVKHSETHLNNGPFKCYGCDKTFNSNDKLANHNKKHSDSVIFKCDVCDMPFKEQVKLNFHLRVHGKGPPINTEKQYLCDICSRTFVSKSGLRFHLKSHTGSKPYTCKYCNKGFTIPSYKIRHERTHTGDKHFVCHICSAAFASSNGLKYHLRIHTGEANYHCETCGKSFRRLKYLKEHTFTHTGERPFACRICGLAYGNSGSLFVHEKKCKLQYVNGTANNAKIE
ncbi:zinc finger protein 37 [Orussus abietinus]|uniref:zinc finger protein 37 n=1 Tax=Orussus abietinus TaxID=222816 RepID=UPI00062621E2|nr:zinc finger protein 37 [Orussus abietinus]